MLSERAKSLKPSPTLALAAKAKELKAEGKDVISLSVGEPDWDTFQSIKRVGIEAIESGCTKYSPANGLPELRSAIAKQTNSDFGMDYNPNDVTVTTGGKFVIFSALQVLCNPQDEVIIPAPYWVSYPTMVELADGLPRVVLCDKASGFKLTPKLLRENINEKTKILILNSPSNPTGCMYTEAELKALSEVLLEHPKIVILSDDIYNRLVFNGEGLAPHILKVEPRLKDRTLVLNGASKTYSMTGWRVGWAVGPNEIISAMTKFQSQSVSCACTFSQKATLQAIENGTKELEEAKRLLKFRRDFVYEQINTLPNIKSAEPEGAFYVWPDISFYLGKQFKGKKLKTSRDFCQALLEDQMVAAVPGIEFGLDGYLRISYALNEDRMSEAIKRIECFIEKIQ